MVHKPSDDPEYEKHFKEDELSEHTVGDFFKEHWPTLFFVGMFLIMMIMGLVFAGISEGYTQIPINALFIFLAFAIGLVLVFFKPRLLVAYLGVIVLAALLYYQPGEIHYNKNVYNFPFLTLIWILFLGFGMYMFYFRRKGDDKNNE